MAGRGGGAQVGFIYERRSGCSQTLLLPPLNSGRSIHRCRNLFVFAGLLHVSEKGKRKGEKLVVVLDFGLYGLSHCNNIYLLLEK